MFAFVDTGMGHRAPALAVREYLERASPKRFDVVLVDLLAELGLEGLDRFAKAVWSKWLLRHPLLIDSAYWTGHVYSAVLLPAMAFFLAPQFRRLERYCRRLHADLLVTTHILSTNPLAILRRRGCLGAPVAGMVVDPFDKYRISGHAGLDALITFSHRSMAAYRAMYPTVDVVRFGFPLSARFDSRPAPRLRTRSFTLLMTAGAEGGGKLREYVERILAASLGIRIVVVCGRDESLRRRLRSLVHGSTPADGSRPECAVLGFVDNMDELISSCDLFVGTGGANLTMEALALGRPTILTLYCPNVRGTVDWVVRHGFGWRCTRADSFVPLVRKLLRRPEMLREAERRIATAALRSGTPELSDYLARLASRCTEPAPGRSRHAGRNTPWWQGRPPAARPRREMQMSAQKLSKADYEKQVAATRDERMAWWREARFGMFIHYGLYAQVGRNEWVQSIENYPVAEYEKLAHTFSPKPGAPREWAALARKAGMKYMVLTTRHHEGFSLWDSKANPYNSVNYGPKRDIVREFVDACREFGLRIGFYSSLMDWHHPDSWRCAFDSAARARFTAFITELNRELMTQYGTIDILWYDVARPMETWEGWDSLERNQMVRSLQPRIIINNRSRLDEDFGTPEGHVTAEERDWEACMTFNDISWGYVDSAQAAPYSYTPQRILKMLNTATAGRGNLLLNIGPTPDGSVPEEAVAPLTAVGKWLAENGQAAYGKKEKSAYRSSSGVCGTSFEGNTVYFWNWIWPSGGTMALGGFATPARKVTILGSGTPVQFEQRGQRIILKGLPARSPDATAGVAVIAVEFTQKPVFNRCSYYPQLHGGVDWAGPEKI